MLIIIYFIAVFANNDVKDVREILDYFKQYDDPIKAFRENLRILKVIYDKIKCMRNINSYVVINVYFRMKLK